MKIQIKKDERGLLYKEGDFIDFLLPGKHSYSTFKNYHVDIQYLNEPFIPEQDLSIYLENETLKSELDIIDVQDNERVVHIENGKFKDVLEVGEYAFWNVINKHEFIHVPLEEIGIDSSISKSLIQKLIPKGIIHQFKILSHERGLFIIDGKYGRTLEPGVYHFWNGDTALEVNPVDMRQLQIEVNGQEILTLDKVTLRINFVCQYKITDPVKVILDIKDYEEQIYTVLQLILREYVGTLKLDDLLANKDAVAEHVLSQLQSKYAHWGLDFIFAGVKDIILPGEIREIMNKVIEAEKKAQANIITRREETASTRSLLNTVKLMEDNPLLLRLKEMEYIDKISDKITGLSVVGGGALIEQLKEIFRPGDYKEK